MTFIHVYNCRFLAQGGIPQCSELLARYIALLLNGERTLPKNYDVQALIEGRAEAETFYATPHTLALVEFSPFANSVARLIGCEPSAPILSPTRFIKFWTLPLWTCFYRLNGPGANPQACWDVVDKYRVKDTLVPMPLLIIFIVFGTLMQPLMILEYIFGPSLLDRGQSSSEVLPRFFHWRVGSHFHQLSGNSLRFTDLLFPSSGWLLAEAILFKSCDDIGEIAKAHVIFATIVAVLISLHFCRNPIMDFLRSKGIIQTSSSEVIITETEEIVGIDNDQKDDVKDAALVEDSALAFSGKEINVDKTDHTTPLIDDTKHSVTYTV